MSAPTARPRIGVIKFASCDGCQLTLLDLEDELLALTERIEIVEFAEATSARCNGPFDILFVEGSVSAPEHVERIQALRREAKVLVAIGACATAGGIQALRNFGDHAEYARTVYPTPQWVASLATSTPISAHVTVDYELRGCPIDPDQLVELIVALTTGRRPQLRDEAVCGACKRAGTVCVMVATGEPCLGQLTQGGCGAICPRLGRACYGCFGPRDQANVRGFLAHLATRGHGDADVDADRVMRLFGGVAAWAEPYRAVLRDLAPGDRRTKDAA